MKSILCTGHYRTWSEALAASTGYYLPEFVERTRQAAMKVRNGIAVYERDSVLFDEIHHSFPLLAGLLRAAVEDHGELIVVDFGGGFGTSYFQCRQFLKAVRSLKWIIVDQPSYFEHGRRDFESNELRFMPDADAVWNRYQPNVLLLSSVLPYLPAPYELLANLLQHSPRNVIVDRTFFLTRDADRLTVQHGPFEIYPGSYPAWFLSEQRLRSTVESHGYELLLSFDGFDRVEPDDEGAYSRGFIWRSCST